MLELLRAIPDPRLLLKLMARLRAAGQGDPRAVEYFRSKEAVRDLGSLFFPGREYLLEDIVERGETLLSLARDLLEGRTPYVDGQFRPAEPGPPPWSGFLRRLKAQTHGVHLILGPWGTGKTELAKKLAWVWRKELGYEAEFLNMYLADRPAWGRTLTAETLLERMEQLSRHLRSEAEPGGAAAPPLPPQRRVIVADEASLTFERGQIDRVRNAVFAAMGNCRHVEWLIVLVAQFARMIPLEYFSAATVWVKRPEEDISAFDRDNPVITRIWDEAIEAFDGLSRLPWYQPPYDDPRAWAYVVSPPLNYEGLVPFTPAPKEEEG